MPRVFIDTGSIETGAEWPKSLERALLRSCFLVPVLSPNYFRSRWCVAELQTMRERERVLNLRTIDNPRGLIHGVRFHDGDAFPPEVRSMQQLDVTDLTWSTPAFRETAAYVDLERKVRDFVDELAAALVTAPGWCDGWPVATPEPEADPSASALPRLGG